MIIVGTKSAFHAVFVRKQRPWKWRTVVTVSCLLIVAALAVIVVIRGSRSPKRPTLPIYGQLHPFHLIDRKGQPATLADLNGRVWIADFIFTRCPGQCPLMTMRMSQIRPGLPKGVRLVSITIDPQADTPAVIDQYATNLGVPRDDPGWLFPTGKQEDV